MLSGKPLAAVTCFAKVEAVLEQIGEGAISEGDRASVLAFDRSRLADDALGVQLVNQRLERSQDKIALKHHPHGLSFRRINNELFGDCIIAERDTAAGPFALLAGGRHLVLEPLRGEFPLESREGQQHVQCQPPHRG